MNKALKNLIACTLTVFNIGNFAAFAVNEDPDSYKYQYEDDVYKYDTDEFKAGTQLGTDKNKEPYQKEIDILKSFGIYDQDVVSGILKQDLFLKTVAKLRYDQTSYKTSDFDALKDTITPETAAEYMVDILGYLNVTHSGTPYSVAVNKDLFKGLSLKQGSDITVGEFAKIVLNTLDTAPLVIDSSSGGTETYAESDKTLFELLFKTYKLKGFVDAINQKSIFAGLDPNPGYVTIDGVEYKSGSSNAEKYFANYVEAYIRTINGEDEIIYINKTDDGNSFEVDFKDITEVTDTSMRYEDADGKEEKVNISALKFVVCNYDIVNDISYLKDYDNYDGTVLITKSTKTGNFDTAVIYRYDYLTVYSVDTYNDKLRIGNDQKINGSDELDMEKPTYLECTLDSKTVEWTALYSGQVFRLLANSDFSHVEITAYTEKVNGTITNIDDDKYYIGDTYYYIAKSYSTSGDYEKIETGKGGSFSIADGKYIADYNKSNQVAFAYLPKAGVVADEATDGIKLNIFDSQGKWQSYMLAKSITLDGVKVKNEDTIKNRLYTEGVRSAPIRYKINSSGEITFIDTTIMTDEERNDTDSMVLSYEANIQLSWYGQWFRSNDGYLLSSDAVAFRVPDNESNKEDYSVSRTNNLGKDGTYLHAKLYNSNNMHLCNLAVMGEQTASASSLDNESNRFYVNHVVEGLDDDEEKVYYLKGLDISCGKYNSATEKTFFAPHTLVTKMEKLGTPFGVGMMFKYQAASDKLLDIEVEMTNGTLPDFGGVTSIKSAGYYQFCTEPIQKIDPEPKSEGGKGIVIIKMQESLRPIYLVNALEIDSVTKKARAITCGDLSEGENAYVYYATGCARILCVVR